MCFESAIDSVCCGSATDGCSVFMVLRCALCFVFSFLFSCVSCLHPYNNCRCALCGEDARDSRAILGTHTFSIQEHFTVTQPRTP